MKTPATEAPVMPSKRWLQNLRRIGGWSARHSRIWWYRWRSTLSVHGSPHLHQPLHAVGHGRLTFTGRVTLGSDLKPDQTCRTYIEARGRQAFVCIGHNTLIGNGCAVIAQEASVLIGSHVRIGREVHIFDTRHTLNLSLPRRPGALAVQHQPVVVEDDVVIGAHARICGGVTIRRGARIESHSVVTSDVPEHAVFAGEPARLVSYVRPTSWHPYPRARPALHHRWA